MVSAAVHTNEHSNAFPLCYIYLKHVEFLKRVSTLSRRNTGCNDDRIGFKVMSCGTAVEYSFNRCWCRFYCFVAACSADGADLALYSLLPLIAHRRLGDDELDMGGVANHGGKHISGIGDPEF